MLREHLAFQRHLTKSFSQPLRNIHCMVHLIWVTIGFSKSRFAPKWWFSKPSFTPRFCYKAARSPLDSRDKFAMWVPFNQCVSIKFSERLHWFIRLFQSPNKFCLGTLVIESNFVFRASLNTFFAPFFTPSLAHPFSQQRAKIARKQAVSNGSLPLPLGRRAFQERQLNSFHDNG